MTTSLQDTSKFLQRWQTCQTLLREQEDQCYQHLLSIKRPIPSNSAFYEEMQCLYVIYQETLQKSYHHLFDLRTTADRLVRLYQPLAEIDENIKQNRITELAIQFNSLKLNQLEQKYKKKIEILAERMNVLSTSQHPLPLDKKWWDQFNGTISH